MATQTTSRKCPAELIERAAMLWARRCEREGRVSCQPCSVSSTFNQGSSLVELVNINGPLAQYKYFEKTDRLRLILQKEGT